jgi:hypothetical protein
MCQLSWGELDQQHAERDDHQQIEWRHQPAAAEQYGFEHALGPLQFGPRLIRRDDLRMLHVPPLIERRD